jgi:hypothetical protein
MAVLAAVGPQQGYLSYSDAAAPVDRLAQRKTLDVDHRPQRLASLPLSVPD